MSNRAWVTLATNDSYGLGALVLAHSLRSASSAYPAVILITPSVTEAMRERLRSVFAELIIVDVLDSRDATHLALLQRPELGITFTKIHCWSLTQYEKCVFLDADTLIVQNCDELFDREELSAAPDVGWPDCFNSGVFVFTPSADTYSRLISFAQERGSFDGGDQGLLNAFFSDWARGDINKHLPFLYNVTSAAFYSYLPALKHYGQNLKIIHFIGNAKPWLQHFNWDSRSVDAPEHLQEFLQLWWDLFVSQVHPQLDTAMEPTAEVEAPYDIAGYPEDTAYHYEPILDSESEFPWHRPETQNQEPTEYHDLHTAQYHDPWMYYRGNIPANSENNFFRDQHQTSHTSQEHSERETNFNHDHWHSSHIFQEHSAHENNFYQDHRQTSHTFQENFEHQQNFDQDQGQNSHTFPEYSERKWDSYPNNSGDQRCENVSHYHTNNYHDSSNVTESDQPRNQYNNNSYFQEPYHQDFQSQNYGQSQLNHNSNKGGEIYSTSNKESNNWVVNGFDKPRVQQVYRLHQDVRYHSRSRRRAHKLREHTAACGMTNGHESDTNSEEDYIIPRHPYDGFYLRHRPTYDSRGRKICLHEVPPTPSPSPSPESLPSLESMSVHSEDFHSASECEENSGVAGNLARVVPGEAGYPREAIDELSRRQGWEAGNIDYMGADSFDNIWAKISQTLNQQRTSPPKQPSPPRKEPTPPKTSEPQAPATAEPTVAEAPAADILAPVPAPDISSPAETAAVVAPSETPADKPVASDAPAVPVAPVAVDAPAAVETPAVVEAPATVETPAVVPSPAAVEVPVAVEAPAPVAAPEAVQAPAPVEAPAAVETSTGAETPAAAEVPAVVEAPAPKAPVPEAAPAVVATPAAVEAPASVETPAPVEAPAPEAAPAVVEAATAVEAPAPVEPAAVEAPATVEAPAAVEAPAVVEAPITTEVAAPVGAPVSVEATAAVGAPAAVESQTTSETPPSSAPQTEPAAQDIPKTVQEVLTTEKTDSVPPSAPATQAVSEVPKVEAVSEAQSTPASEAPKATELAAEAAVASVAETATTLAASVPSTEASAVTPTATDSPPLANTPSKEEAPVVPTGKSEERRKPAGKLQLSPPAAADPLPTPDSEQEDAAALAHAIIASELSATVTAPSPATEPASPVPPKDEVKLSVDKPEVPTPPVSLEQIGVKPKAKPSTAAQIESSVAEKAEPTTPTSPTTSSEPGTPTAEAPKKKTVKKTTKKEAGSSGDVPTPVPPPRKKEKKPKEK